MNTPREPFRSQRAVIVNEVYETQDTKTLTLRVNGEYTAEPGQFNMIYYWGVGEVPVSISNLPLHREGYTLVEHTVKSVGTVTKAIVGSTKVGSSLGLRGPYGRGWPLREYEGFNLLLVAGGLGLAPLRPVIKYVSTRRDAYGKFYILYGARTPGDLLYKYELDEYSRIPGSKLLLSSDKWVEEWKHHVGFVTDLIDHVDLNPAETVVFVCGPEIMMKVAVTKLLHRGFRKDRVYVSLERRMRCGVGVCGTCQLGHLFVCKNGPVFSYEEVEDYLAVEGM
ncbi:MAG: FAD/NAD(P)-binding protein [Desulfurococcaceae archaeon]